MARKNSSHNAVRQIASLNLIFLLMLVILSSTLAAHASGSNTTFSGRAVGAIVKTPLTGSIPFADTGPLPPSGGFISATPITIATSVANVQVFHSVTSGFGSEAESQATVADVVLLPGSPNQITAEVLFSQTKATCSGVSGSSDIASLTLAGKPITVAESPNQVVSVPGVLTLVINEQTVSGNSITVNALHLTAIGGIEVIVSSAHSDISCATPLPPPKCMNFVTGGGWISPSNGKDTFGFNAGLRGDCELKGHLEYQDHGAGIRVSTSSITSYGGSGNTRTFSGLASVNGQTVSYTVTAVDNGDPGAGVDQFTITLSTGYTASGTLGGGNIEIHT